MFVVGHRGPNYDESVNEESEEKQRTKRAKRAAYMREWTARNRADVNAKRKARKDANREKVREQARSWHAANPGKAAEYMRGVRERAKDDRRGYQNEWHRANRHRSREYGLKTRYGITAAQWDALFEAQGSRCGICGSPRPSSRQGWSTDHCHATGAVRGILCAPCNTLLGKVGDSDIAAGLTFQRISLYLATCTERAALAASAPAEWTDLRRAGAGRRFRKRTSFSPAFVTTFASPAAPP